ncbi:hypothetical protein DRJ90_14845 [Enterococcus faecalis]|uniref:hypothetical protein n=1 Tax=Enterococcus faecalis TaxID=1351 RepID=UPI000F80E8C0|nr:hypothetical protein [Enterococcus faecalis]RTK32600.1 hypothetical protein DRJ90_14845 [Enterococcus faecalis]
MLLKEGLEKGFVEPTEYTKRLTIDGITKPYQIYKIRLDQLFYNDQNDRIATWINKYKEEHDIEHFENYDDDYNEIIEKFIYESNSKAIDKTQKNIELVGQREAGVVLNDGRVIDGNRRYTCLRRLYNNGNSHRHFEAVILDRDINVNKKEIKLLELSIQHGEEGKVDYNPIDRLVGLYNDVIKNKLITPEEYQQTVNESKSSINKKMEQANLMVEFLEFLGAPEKFYIARDLELDGPLGEIPVILNKVKTDEEKEDLKLIIFTNLLMKPKGDITRFVRKIKTVADSEYAPDFIDEQMDFVENIAEKIESIETVSSKIINDNLRSNEDLQDEMVQSLEKFEIKTKKDNTRMKPIQDLQKFQVVLEMMDLNILSSFDNEKKEEVVSIIDNLQDILDEIKKELKDEES